MRAGRAGKSGAELYRQGDQSGPDNATIAKRHVAIRQKRCRKPDQVLQERKHYHRKYGRNLSFQPPNRFRVLPSTFCTAPSA